MATYQQRLPLRGGSPTLKELRARQFQPSPPSKQPPVSKAPGVNPQQLPLNLPEPAAAAPALNGATPVPPQTGGGMRQFAGKALQFAGKAAPYVTGALVAADVVRRARTDDPRGVQRADVLANLDTRGLGPADAFLFAPKTPASEADPRVAIHKTTQEALAKRMAERAGKPVEPDPYGLRPDRLQPSALAHPMASVGDAGSTPPAPAPAAPAPAAVPQTPEQVFSDLQQQRGFSPLGGVDPNATNPPTLFQRTDAIRTRPGSANPNDVQALQDYRQTGFGDAQQGVAAAQEALRRNPNDPQARQQLTRAEADFTGAQQALTESQGPLERRQYAGPGGSVSGVTSVNTPRGGFVGAATDVAAARNLQARFEQDAAASQIAAGYDRETERLRDARAEKMGISRAKLDASEGRSNPLTSLFSAQGQPQQAAPEAFSQPGDGFGDAAMRRSALERQMADTRTSGSERRAAAEAYKGFLSPAHGTGAGGPANGHSPDLFSMVDKMRDNQRADQNLALQNQQLQETRRSNAFNQALNATKEDRAAREQFRVQGKDAQDEIVKAASRYVDRHTDKKTGRGPDLGPIRTFGTQLSRSPSLQSFDSDMARRLMDGAYTEADWEQVGQMRQMFENSKPGLSTLYLGSPMSADEIVQRYFQINSPKI